MRRAYDSTNPFDIPISALIVCGYIDGIYVWSNAGWARFPHAVHVRIAISPFTNDGHVLDVETGDATPAQAPNWVLMRRADGVDPTVYINRANWAATRAAFQQRGIAEPHYWLAAYDGIPEVPAGTVAKQYANSALSGGHYDLSAVADYWPGVDAPGSIAGSEVRIGGLNLTAEDEAIVVQVAKDLYGGDATHPKGWIRTVLEELDIELLKSPQGDGVRAKFSTLGTAVLDIQAKVTKLDVPQVSPDALTTALADIKAQITRIQNALHSA